jgi:hypothetical protein
MSKFKVGDKVRIKINSEYYRDGDALNPKHEVGIVDEVDSDDYISVEWVSGTNCYRDSDLELAKYSPIQDSPSELDEALAKIDSLEELVSELSQELRVTKEIEQSVRYRASVYDLVVKLLGSHSTAESVYRGQHGEEVITDTIKLLQKSYDERTTLFAAVKSLKMIIADNIEYLDKTELDTLSVVGSTLKDILKSELE